MVLKDRYLSLNVIKIFLSAFFNEVFENIWVKANRGDVDIFLIFLNRAVKDEQMSLILERERAILRRKG